MAEQSVWAPFNDRLFRMLWVATLVSNIGTWTQDVANGWLMATLAPRPLMVSLVQTATSLPMFLLALPAGALADVVDRRRYLLAAQTWMMCGAALMGVLTVGGWMTPWRLVGTTFLMSLGSAMSSPAWHAVTPEVVPRERLAAAVSLNGLAINGARTVGPALGGAVVVALGPGAAFLLNAATFLVVLTVLASWRRNVPVENLPSERFWSSIRVGLQFVRHSQAMRATLARAAMFVGCNSALWALVPLLSKQAYGLGPRGYGLLMTCFGVGAVSGAVWALPRLRRRWTANAVVMLASSVFGLALLGLAAAERHWLQGALMWLGGCSWICVMSSFHLAAQSVPPAWVRARSMSVYILSYFGASAAGSTVWGLLAGHVGLRNALTVGGALMLCTALVGALMPLRTGEGMRLEPSHHWEDPEVAIEVPLRHGPVMVTVEYEVDPTDVPEFRSRMEGLRRWRFQNGVLRWGLFIDLARPRSFREVYLEESWSAHLRHHQRVTGDELDIAKTIYQLHRGEGLPRVSHHLYCDSHFPPEIEMRRPAAVNPLWFLDDPDAELGCYLP